MVMKLVWHPFALDDLAQIVKYCHHNFGIQIARRVRSKYQSDITLLKKHPSLGFVEPLLVNFGTLEYRSLIIESTKVIYTIHTNYIYIHLLWDCRRQPESLRSEVRKRQE